MSKQADQLRQLRAATKPAPPPAVESKAGKAKPEATDKRPMMTTAIRIPVDLYNLLSEVAGKRAREARADAARQGKDRPADKRGRVNTSALIAELCERHRAELEAEL